MPIRRVQITELEARAAKLEKALKLATRTAQADLDTAVFPTGRLTLNAGSPINTGSVSNSSNVYYLPYIGASVPIFNGSQWTTFSFDDLTLSLSSNAAHTGYHQADKNFDVFVYREEVTGTLRLGTGPAWSSDTARGTGAGTTEITRLNGLYVNAYDIQIRYGSGANDYATIGVYEATYLGTIRTSGDGLVDDYFAGPSRLFVWNAYNRTPRMAVAKENTDNWNYSTASWRQVNGSANNQIGMVLGLLIEWIDASAYHMVFNSTSTARRCSTGIGAGSTSANSAQIMNNSAVINQRTNMSAHYRSHPGIGYRYLAWLEYGAGANTQTWYGDNGDATTMQSGMVATVWC